MSVEEQAEKLINEAYIHAPSSGATKEGLAIRIAIWCASNIASNLGASANDEFWSDVINYLNNKV